MDKTITSARKLKLIPKEIQKKSRFTKKQRILFIILTIIGFLVTFTLMIKFVSAVPPFQQETQALGEGYVIRVPVEETIQQNENHEFYFHVYNITDGTPVHNKSHGGVTCDFHLYDPDGTHIVKSPLVYDDSHVNNEWEVEIVGANFSALGRYSYIVQCNSSLYGGFESIGLNVNYFGEDLSTAQSVLYGWLIFVLIFIFGMNIFLINKLPAKNEQDEQGRIMSISWLKYLRGTLWFVEWMIFVAILYASSGIAFAYLGEQIFANLLFSLFRICMAMAFPMLIIWIIWIIVQWFHDKEFQRLLKRGIFPKRNL
jgi:hypothetical protein